jgi:hypothetical protein
MFEQMLQQFLGSSQGQAALQTLQQQHGMDPAMAQQTLGVAGEGAAQALHQVNGGAPGNAAGLLGGGLTTNAITGALSGMLNGGGLGGALEGGLSGIVAGKVGEMLASRMGMNPQMASMIAAGIAPHLVNFIQARMGSQNASGPGAPASGTAPVMGHNQGAAASMQPMGGPQWAPPMQKGPGAQGKFDPFGPNNADPSQQQFSKGGGGGKEAYQESPPDGGKGGYTKGGFDPSQDGSNKDQGPGWKKGG